MRRYKNSNINIFNKDLLKKQINLSINLIDLMQNNIDRIKPSILITQDRLHAGGRNFRDLFIK